jgi:hypothetical protein
LKLCPVLTGRVENLPEGNGRNEKPPGGMAGSTVFQPRVICIARRARAMRHLS